MTNIKLELDWIVKDTDCRKCISCGDVIFSDMYMLTYKMKTGIILETDIVICQSCKEL